MESDLHSEWIADSGVREIHQRNHFAPSTPPGSYCQVMIVVLIVVALFINVHVCVTLNSAPFIYLSKIG